MDDESHRGSSACAGSHAFTGHSVTRVEILLRFNDLGLLDVSSASRSLTLVLRAVAVCSPPSSVCFYARRVTGATETSSALPTGLRWEV